LLILLCGVSGILVGLSGYLVPDIRNIEKSMPDTPTLPSIGIISQLQLMDEQKKIRVRIWNHHGSRKLVSKIAKNIRGVAQRKGKGSERGQK
jgi:hypothetical protein